MAERTKASGIFKGYVYLKYYNYLRYRTSTPKSTLQSYENRVLNLQLRNLGKGYDLGKLSVTCQKLEDYLNSYFSTGDVLETKMSENTKKLINNYIVKQLNKKMNNAFYSVKTLTGYQEQALSLKEDVDISTSKIQKFDTHYYRVWERRVEELLEFFKFIQFNSQEQSQRIQQQVDELLKKWNSIVKLHEKIGKNKIPDRYKRFQNFKIAFNNLIDTLFTNLVSSEATGIIGESFVAAGLYTFFNTINQQNSKIFKEIDKMLVGTKSTQKGLNLTKRREATHSEWNEVFGQKTNMSYVNNGVFNTQATQDKVDVIYNVPFGNTTLSATVKNYNLQNTSNIHFVSGTNLLTITSADDDFVSHYLNVTSWHGYYANERRKIEPDSGVLTTAHNVMRKLILYRSIAGGLFTKGRSGVGYMTMPDIFILNDNSKGGVKVIPVDILYSNIVKDMSNIIISENTKTQSSDVKISGYPGNAYKYSIDGWEYWKWYPRDGGDQGRRRMLNLYKQMRQIKINVSVRAKVFKDLYKT